MAQPEYDRDDYASDDELITGEAVALDLRPASFVVRGAGAMIDFAVTIAVIFGVVILIDSTTFGAAIDTAAFQAISISLIVFLTIVVPTGVETLTSGKSLGKLVMGTRIVRDDGGAIGFRHAFIRALLGFLEIVMTVGGLAILVALLNTRSKRLGDLVAGTFSTRERVRAITDPVFIVPPQLESWASTADVARMPDRLSRRIAQFLVQAGGMLPATRERLALELQAEAAPFVDSMPLQHAELFLVAVTAIRRDRESRALDLERERMSHLEPVLSALPHDFPNRA